MGLSEELLGRVKNIKSNKVNENKPVNEDNKKLTYLKDDLENLEYDVQLMLKRANYPQYKDIELSDDILKLSKNLVDEKNKLLTELKKIFK